MVILVHYHRADGSYGDITSDDPRDFWGLHVSSGTARQSMWSQPIRPAGRDAFGVYFVILLNEEADTLQYVIHRGEAKERPEDRTLHVAFDGQEVWIVHSVPGYVPAPTSLNLAEQRAYWLTRDTLAWGVAPNPYHTYRLHYDPDGKISHRNRRLIGGRSLPLNIVAPSAPVATDSRFPHLDGLPRFTLNTTALQHVPTILKSRFVVSETDLNEQLLNLTSLQIPGVLDDLYAYDGPLGLSFDGDVPTLRLWAPTARYVALHLFADATTSAHIVLPLIADPTTGVWQITGMSEWIGQFYLYEVKVFAPTTRRFERNLVTDPYAVSLSANSARSQIINLDNPDLKPAGWDTLVKPPLDSFADMSIYELHVRDFSISDPSVPESVRGTFKAFTLPSSYGMRHLRALAEAGLTHLHVLPVFDVASIEERKEARHEPDATLLRSFAPDSNHQQAIVMSMADQDGFNWGYDPCHYGVPEGSYATNPDGATRIREFREMVQALSQTGLRVVMDVVYNHTFAAGQSDKSVLDKVVPGYYYRLNAVGAFEQSTCCPNTATEHIMMERLMLDTLRRWATAYKVDAFRFDLMGHHMRANMLRVRDMLQGLTLEHDGVDGSTMYIYGEGWDFGEVAHGARGANASQLNMAGTGIGTFSDRLRDVVRGGSNFGSSPQEQGFATGLLCNPNGVTCGSLHEQWQRLTWQQDVIRVALAGNLKAYRFTDRNGVPLLGTELRYNDQPAGYAESPLETVSYVSAHDNETLFDVIQIKASATATLDDRVRMNNLALSLVGLGQGIPFFHAGDDMLRSKSLDRNSYNSGDWFNRLDFTYTTNNWGVGLPPARENAIHWPMMASLLGDPSLQADKSHILKAVAALREILRIRKSSRLFRLGTTPDIQHRVTFHNTGPHQLPGLIVMSISDMVGEDLDPQYRMIVVLFHAHTHLQHFHSVELAGMNFVLHPIQIASADPIVRQSSYDATTGTFSVPGRTTAVFVAA